MEGAEVYYEADGSGDALLLIHAGVADCRMWDEQMTAFAPYFRTIRFDMRGFGRTRLSRGAFSYHEDVAALLDALGHETAHIVAISFGGRVALDFALAYPHRVRSLVLGAPSVSGAEDSARVQRFVAEEEAALEAGDLDGAVELNLRLWVDGPERGPEEVDAAVRRLVGEMQRTAFLVEGQEEATLKPQPEAAIGRLPDVTVPVLLVSGSLDLEEKRALAEDVAFALPRGRHISLPAAHMMSLEQPAAFNKAVLGFLLGQAPSIW